MLETPKADFHYSGESEADMSMGNQQVTETDLAWLAGIYDGEGWFSLKRNVSRNDVCVNLSIGIVNTDANIINKAVEILTELGVSPYVYERQHDVWKTRYDIEVKKFGKAKVLLEALMPYLIAKDGQAKLLLRFVDMRLERGKARYGKDEEAIFTEYNAKHARFTAPQRLHAAPRPQSAG